MLTGILLAFPGALAMSTVPIPGGTLVRNATGTTTVHLNVTDQLSFVPSSITVPTRTVTFVVQDLGSTAHTFTLSSRVNTSAPSGTSTSNATGSYFAWPNLLADRTLNATQSIAVTVTFPTWGSYQFICRYHFPNMQGTVTVGGSPAAPAANNLWIVELGVPVMLVVIVAIFLLLRRKAKNPPSGPEPKGRDERPTS